MTPLSTSAAQGTVARPKPKRSEHELALRREQKKRARARNPEKEALRHFLYRKRKGVTFERERYNAWVAANPEKISAKMKRRRKRPGVVERERMNRRKLKLRTHPDKPAVQKQIAENVARLIPGTLSPVQQSLLTAEMIKAIYAGRLPVRVKVEHALMIATELGLALTSAPAPEDRADGERMQKASEAQNTRAYWLEIYPDGNFPEGV